MRRILWGLGVIGAVALSALVVEGGKPGGGTPPPPPPTLPGIIYHLRDQTAWAVRPDGTGLTQVLPAGTGINPMPCFHAQGPDAIRDRWYLGTLQTGVYDEVTTPSGATSFNVAHYDLFAFRTVPGNPSQIESVQLTDLFGIFRISAGQSGNWSIDSNDDPATSFVQAVGRDIRETFVEVDGYSYYDARGLPDTSLRLPLTAGDITEGWLVDAFTPFRPAVDADLDSKLGPVLDAQPTPDGTALVQLGQKILLLDPQNPNPNAPLSVVWDGTSGEPSNPSNFWQNNVAAISPDSSKLVVINWYNDSRGGVWILSLDGSSPPKQITQNASKGTSSTRFDQVLWSPDSQYILTRRVTAKAGTFAFDQLLVPAGGGAAVQTFLNSPMWGVRWTSSSTAP